MLVLIVCSASIVETMFFSPVTFISRVRAICGHNGHRPGFVSHVRATEYDIHHVHPLRNAKSVREGTRTGIAGKAKLPQKPVSTTSQGTFGSSRYLKANL